MEDIHISRPKAYRLASQYSDSSNGSSNVQTAVTSTEDRLEDRRRQSLRVMAAMSLNKSYSDAINGVSINKSDLEHEEDCTSKLQEIFIRAKESGMTYDDIFKKFCLKHEVTSTISSKAFVAALRKLSPDIFCLTETDVGLLVRRFEVNEDKVVSLDELKTFALAIPHVSWKVERIRRLSSALSLSDSTNRSDSGRASDSTATRQPAPRKAASRRSLRQAVSFSRQTTFPKPLFSEKRKKQDTKTFSSTSISPILPSTASIASTRVDDRSFSPECCRSDYEGSQREQPRITSHFTIEKPTIALSLLSTTSKLMWREQEHLILRLYGHDDPPRIIAVTAKSKGTGKNYPAIYLDRDKIPLNRKAIEALADALPSDAGAHGQSIDALTSLQRAEREYLAQYVVQRLALEDVSRESGRETAKRMCIVRQTGDPWEKLTVEKPKLIKSPRSSPEMRLRPAMDFHHTSLEVKNMNYETKRHSNVAKFYSNLSKTELKDVPST